MRTEFSIYINFLTVLLYWPIESKNVYITLAHKIISSIKFILVYIVFFAMDCVVIYENSANVEQMVSESFIVFTLCNFLAKAFRYTYCNSRIKGVLEDISSDIFEPKDKQSKDVIKMAMAYSKRIFYVYVVACCSFGFLLGAGAIISEEHHALPFNFWYPFNKTHGFGYKAALAYEALSISSNAMAHATMDSIVYSTLAFIRVQLALLNEDLRNLGSMQHNTCQAILEQQILCIKKHQAIKRIIRELNKIITFPMFVQSTVGAITLCMSVYKLTGVELLTEEGISYIMYCVAMHAQLSIPFWYGNEIIWKSNELTISASQCNWIEQNKCFKSNLLIFLMSTIKPIEVSGGYFIVMSLEPLITILKCSWSYTAILRSI